MNIIVFEPDKEIAWDHGPDIPVPHFSGYRLDAGDDGVTNVTSYYDWSKVEGDRKDRFPIVPDSALRATLGILERTVRKGLELHSSGPGREDDVLGRPFRPTRRLRRVVEELRERIH